MRGVLDLAALVTILDRGKNSAHSLDLAKLFENRRFDCALDRFHAGRSAQHIHGVLKDSRLFEQDGLPMRS